VPRLRRQWVERLLPPAALERVGLFPESFGSYFEDVDLAFRLRRAGFQACTSRRRACCTTSPHRTAAAAGGLSSGSRATRSAFFWRNMPASALAPAAPRHLAVLAGKAWRRCQDGTLTPWLLGRLRVLGEVRELMRHRHALRDVATWKTWPDCMWKCNSGAPRNEAPTHQMKRRLTNSFLIASVADKGGVSSSPLPCTQGRGSG